MNIKKILLISDFGVHHNPGGAQRSNQIILEEGFSRGYEIQCFHYDSDLEMLNSDYDLIISSNLEVISSRYPKIVESIPNVKNHVRLEHDSNLYWNNDFRKHFWSSCRISFFLTEFHHNLVFPRTQYFYKNSFYLHNSHFPNQQQ